MITNELKAAWHDNAVRMENSPLVLLVQAYRHWRTPNNGHNRSYRFDAKSALANARGDVAAKKRRYSGTGKPYPAVSWQPIDESSRRTRERWGHVDDPSAAGLRFVGRVMAESYGGSNWRDTSGSSGWFTDPSGDHFRDGSGLCYGVVYQLPGRDGKSRFVAGYEFGGCDGGPTLDFGEVFESDFEDEMSRALASIGKAYHSRDMYKPGYWAQAAHESAMREAARRADEHARVAADHERAYQTAWQAGQQWADVQAEIEETRQSIKDDLATRRTIRAEMQRHGIPTTSREWSRACEMIANRVSLAISEIAELRCKRDKLASGDHDGLAFYPSERLRAAFNDGADISEAMHQ